MNIATHNGQVGAPRPHRTAGAGEDRRPDRPPVPGTDKASRSSRQSTAGTRRSRTAASATSSPSWSNAKSSTTSPTANRRLPRPNAAASRPPAQPARSRRRARLASTLPPTETETSPGDRRLSPNRVTNPRHRRQATALNCTYGTTPDGSPETRSNPAHESEFRRRLPTRHSAPTSACPCRMNMLSGGSPCTVATHAIRQIRLFGLLLRLVRAGECRVGHDPTAHGCLVALRALDSRERLTSEKDHFRELAKQCRSVGGAACRACTRCQSMTVATVAPSASQATPKLQPPRTSVGQCTAR